MGKNCKQKVSETKGSESEAKSQNAAIWNTVIMPLIATIIGGAVMLLSNYLVEHSKLAKKCKELENKKDVAEALVREKDGRISEYRERVIVLENKISANETIQEMYKVALYHHTGKLLKSEDEVLAASAPAEKKQTESASEYKPGSIGEQLGLTKGMSLREKLDKAWDTKLKIESGPGIFLPARRELLDIYYQLVDLEAKQEYNAMPQVAMKGFREIDPKVRPFINGAQVDRRFALVASLIYRVIAEKALHDGKFDIAAELMGCAAGLGGPRPDSLLLAMESATAYRKSRGTTGYFTQHIRDVTKGDKNNDYLYEIHDKLARLGYLQLFLPNKEDTDIGERIDWDKFFNGKHVHVRSTFERNGDVWSTRWIGLGKYEEYNLSAEFRATCQALKKRKSKGVK